MSREGFNAYLQIRVDQQKELLAAMMDVGDQCPVVREVVQVKEDKPRKRTRKLRITPLLPGMSLLRRLTSRAKTKGFECTLEIKDCADLGECHYCGGPSTGFDRIDSGIGYTLKNTVPACSQCNSMKWSVSQDDFITRCKLIASRF